MESLLTTQEKKFRKIWLIYNISLFSFYQLAIILGLILYLIKTKENTSTSYLIIGIGIFSIFSAVDALFFWLLWRLAYKGFGTKYLFVILLITIGITISPLGQLFYNPFSIQALFTNLIPFFVYATLVFLHAKLFKINRLIKKRLQS